MFNILGIISTKDPIDTTTLTNNFIHTNVYSNPYLLLKVFDDNSKKQHSFSENETNIYIVSAKLHNKKQLAKKINENENISDSEFIIKLLNNKNEVIVNEIYGKWIIIKFNKINKHIKVFCDHAGYYSIFFYYHKNMFYFSTDLRLLLTFNIPRSINKLKIASLSIGFSGLPSETSYNNIKKVPPANCLEIKNNELTFSSFWNIPNSKLIYKNKDDYYSNFKYLLDEILKETVLEENIATTLSSGLDSSFLTAYIANLFTNKTIYAITATPLKSYKEKPFKYRYGNEFPLANKLTQMYPNIIHLSEDSENISILDSLEKTILIHNSPVRNAINQFWIQSIFNNSKNLGVKQLFISESGNITISWPFFTINNSIIDKLKNFLNTNFYFYYSRSIKNFLTFLNPSFVKEYNFIDYLWLNNYFLKYEKLSENSKRLYYLKKNLSIGYTTWQQKANYYDIDVIDPYADPRIINYCFSLPSELFKKANESRLFVKKLAQNLCPAAILNNNKKGLQAADIEIRILKEKENISKLLKIAQKNDFLNEIFEINHISNKFEKNLIGYSFFLRFLLITKFVLNETKS